MAFWVFYYIEDIHSTLILYFFAEVRKYYQKQGSLESTFQKKNAHQRA